jgi:toxin ParE1/3/4
MASYKFTAKAEDDLALLIDYTLQQWGVEQASKYVDGLEVLAGNLAKSPALGRNRDDLAKGLKMFPYQSHVLFYIKERHGITVVRILHESMDAPSHL